MVAKEILEKVARADQERTLRAIQGLTSGAYQVTVAVQDEGRVSGTVANGGGKAYRVTLGRGGALSCSCPDFGHRQAVCKHMVILALRAIQQEEGSQPPKPNLKLARVRSEAEKKSWRELAEELYGPAPGPTIRRLPPKPYEELP